MHQINNLTQINLSKGLAPTEEPARQYHYIKAARAYIQELSAQKGAPLTFHVSTFGCQMNARDSEKLTGILEEIGYQKTDTEEADFVQIGRAHV